MRQFGVQWLVGREPHGRVGRGWKGKAGRGATNVHERVRERGASGGGKNCDRSVPEAKAGEGRQSCPQ